MKKLLLILAIFFPTNILAIEFDGKFIQGHFILGKTNPNSKIIIDDKVKREDNKLQKKDDIITYSNCYISDNDSDDSNFSDYDNSSDSELSDDFNLRSNALTEYEYY